ncbi:kinase phosphorylation protein-domain-containing protein [Gaertneriomyces semiglobifer]|nr:kinase phosphorylation protein-domain-containing protein [Gaertneriomyces semiglobifer]
MFGPTRGGTRGGQGLFKWEDVKEDKYRENYLGHSLLAPVGRWQKNKDLQWYSKGEEGARQQQEAIAAELEEIKQSEADALAEALGYAGPKRRKKDDNSISRKDIESLVKKDLLDSGAVEETQRVEEPKGLGFQSTKARIAAVGMIKDKPGHEESSCREVVS